MWWRLFVCPSKLRPISSIIQQIAHIVANLLCSFCLMGTSWMPKNWLEKDDPMNNDFDCLQCWPLHALRVSSCLKLSSFMHSSLKYRDSAKEYFWSEDIDSEIHFEFLGPMGGWSSVKRGLWYLVVDPLQWCCFNNMPTIIWHFRWGISINVSTEQMFFIKFLLTEASSTNFVIWIRIQLGKFAQNKVIDTKFSKSGTLWLPKRSVCQTICKKLICPY